MLLSSGLCLVIDMAEEKLEKIPDRDRDSMHILPLTILPIETSGLNRARLIKNARLECVVEVFEDEGTGSGQLGVEDLVDEFSWPDTPPHPDLVLMRKLSLLPSFDVYSLRILLREHGIQVNDVSAFQLSDSKIQELSGYMTAFTHPLISEIFGDEDVIITDFSDILALFRDPDLRRAQGKLKAMSKKLDVKPLEIPQFLERFGDIFLSLSYYRQSLDEVAPVVHEFNESIGKMQANHQLKSDLNLMNTCGMVQDTVDTALAGVRKRFDDFDQSTRNMWDNPSAAQFENIRKITQDCYHVMGGVLCGVSVKMRAWNDRFPDIDTGGPVKRAEFIIQQMQQGINQIKIKKPGLVNTDRDWDAE
jgi:hypothetical protein